MTERKAIAWFIVLACGISWPIFLLPLLFGEPGTREHGMAAQIAWAGGMWGPGIAAIIVTRFFLRAPLRALGLRQLGPKLPYLWAWLLPPALAVGAGIVTVLVGAGQFDPELTLIRRMLEATPGAEVVSPLLIVVIQVGAALTVGPVINSIFALGEELGWRGFLLPMSLRWGQGRAIVSSSIVWGLWHAPVIAQGYNYPGRPVAGIFLMTIFCVLIGAIFSWLYLNTGSPWAPTLAHGSLNASAGMPILVVTVPDTLFGGTLLSLSGWVVLALFVAWLLVSRRLPARAIPAAAFALPTAVEQRAAGAPGATAQAEA